MKYTQGGHPHACNCRQCRDAHAAYQRHRSRQIAYGRWQPFTDAGPVRDHVRALMAYGIPDRHLAVLAGVNRSALRVLLYGPTGHPPSARTRTELADKLLAVEPVPANLPDGAAVDAAGVRRRVQALAVAGWTVAQLTERLPVSVCHLRWIATGRRVVVTMGLHRAVRRLYRELIVTPPPETTAGERRRTDLARRRAAVAGWAAAGEWDDDGPHGIDNPAATPYPRHLAVVADGPVVDDVAVERAAAGAPVPRLSHAERLAAAALILARGGSRNQVAERLRLSGTTTRELLEELGQQAAASAVPAGERKDHVA